MTTLPFPKAVAYYRASAPAHYTNAIAVQQGRVRSWARLHHIEIVREFSECNELASGSPPLPAFQKMIEWLGQQNDVPFILCSDLSRVRRLPDQAAEIQRCGKQVISVATTLFAPSGPPVLDP